jgi:hypothetical protein
MITNTDFAYAAGYIDGDGCFYIRKYRSKHTAHIYITSTDKTILDWFKANFGGSIRTPEQVMPGREYQKTVHYYCMSRIESLNLIEAIHPRLVEKAEEAKLFAAFAKSNDLENKHKYIDAMKTLKESTNLVYKDLINKFKAERNTIEPTIEDWAYLAGFIDAECCFYISKYKQAHSLNYAYKISLSCNNSKAPIFRWLLQRFGGSIRFIDRHSKDPKQRDQFAWSISCAALAKILNKIHPFLKYKKPVCEQLMKFYETTVGVGVSRKTEAFRRAYAIIIKERERIVHEVHRLNKKGII